jgi:adenylate cyclase
VGERLNLRPINEVNVKGKRAALQIYELLGVINANNPSSDLEASEDIIEQCKLTKYAYQAFHDRQWNEAVLRYDAVLARFPSDGLALSMLQRCKMTLGLDTQAGF